MQEHDFVTAKTWGPVPKAPHGYTWEQLMELALAEARAGAKAGEIPVGALVCDMQGTILAAAHNASIKENDPTAHAEIAALRIAGKKRKNYRLSDCVLVVTLEPCIMCMGAIREARLAGLVYGAYDKRAGAICSCYEGLNCPALGVNTWHYGGVLADDAIALLQKFFKEKR